MTGLAHGSAALSNKRADKCSVEIDWRGLLHSLFPEKTAAHVANFARTNVRAVEHVLAGRNGPSGSALVNLLRSPVGPRVLDAVAGEAAWRAMERRLLEIAELERRVEREFTKLQQEKSELDRTL